MSETRDSASKAKTPVPTGLALSALNPVFREHPHEVLDRLRVEEPVHKDRQFDRVVLTRYEDVATVVGDRTMTVDPRKSRPGSFARVVQSVDENYQPSMLNMDDPDHKRLRGLVTQGFNLRSVEAMRPRIEAVADVLMDDFARKPSFDVIEDYAGPLPTIVIAEMLGIDPADQKDFKRWSDELVHRFNPARTPDQTASLNHAQKSLHYYLLGVVNDRRVNRGTDLVSLLVAAHQDGEKLSEGEIVSTCNLLLAAGNITTTDLIGNGVLALLRNPDQLEKLRERPDLARNAVEEMLRFDPPVASTGRTPPAAIEVAGVEIAAGQSINCSILAANHDPAIHKDANRFDIERADTRHFAFGGGAHFCLGAPLARAEAQIAIPMLFARFPKLRLDPAHAVEHKPAPVFNGLKNLWVRVD